MIDVTTVTAWIQLSMPPSIDVAPPKSANSPRMAPGLVMVRKNVCGKMLKCGMIRQTLSRSAGRNCRGTMFERRLSRAMFVVAVATIFGCERKTLSPKPVMMNPPNELDLELMISHEARDGGSAKGCHGRDESIGKDSAETGREPAPEAALKRPLDANNVDRTDRRGDEHADDEANDGKSRRIDDRLCPH